MFLLMIPLVALYYLAAGIAALNDRRRARIITKQQADLDAELASTGASLIE
jgi:Sec-independent protein secretion pathway component TatC